MKNYSEDITKYINNSQEFAKPILNRLREIIHQECPDIEEKLSWSRPHYYYKGKGMLVTDGLKERVTFGCWFDNLVFDPKKISKETIRAHESMGFMKSVDDIPDEKILSEIIHVAMEIIDSGVSRDDKKKVKKELVVPKYFIDALKNYKNAYENFEKLSTSHKREYVDWIDSAKTDETKNRRIEQAIEWILDGKSRNWKYQK